MNKDENTKYQLTNPRGSVGLSPKAWKLFWLMKDFAPKMTALDFASKMVLFCFTNLREFLKEAGDVEG